MAATHLAVAKKSGRKRHGGGIKGRKRSVDKERRERKGGRQAQGINEESFPSERLS